MSFLDTLVHFCNFLAPAFGVAVIATLAAKLFWRKELAGTSFLRLFTWAFAACSASLAVGLAITGRDGHMATYGAMLVANALALWWVGLRR